MNPANVPPWGCPWHGPVQGGSLALPNGSNMAYPQPPPRTFQSGPTLGTTNRPQDTYGITHRHAAGLPFVSSSSADIAAGRQWRNEAILSGGRYQVHGKILDGWVYVDPDGARWLARCIAINEQDLRNLAAPLAVTVTLSRFGVLGGAPESYSYPVSLPLDGIGKPVNAHLMLDAFKPNGSQAIIVAHQRGGSTRRIDRHTFGFLELTISGPGATATITAAVVRTWAQIQQMDPPVPPTRLWLDGSSLPWQYYETEPLNYNKIVHEQIGEFSRSSARVLALWYDAAGALEELTMHIEASFTYDAPRVPAPPDYTTGLDFSGSSSMSGTIELRVGGAVVDTLPIAASLSLDYVAPSAVWTFSATIDGVHLTGNGRRDSSWATLPFPDIAYIATGFAVSEGVSSFSFSPEFSSNLYETKFPFALFRAAVVPYWYSRQVIGFEISTEAGAPSTSTRRWRFRAPVTPSGAASGATIDITTPTGPTFYGSHDPYSGAAVWGQSTPVCYV